VVLYLTEVTLGHRTVAAGTAYGNSPEEVRDRHVARHPLKRGETLTVSDFTGTPVLVAERLFSARVA
jgi:hypothetical protein